MIEVSDLLLIGFLAFLEGILSIDNALVLAMMAKHLPREQQRKALTYGLVGAVVFRLVALALVTKIIGWTWVQFIAGGYLLFIAAKHLLKKNPHSEHKPPKKAGFWKTVFMIELMDIAFAVDSILAAVALTKKIWIVFTGGFLGVILMRFAATGFIKMIDRFPNFETTAYFLVGIIGIKVILEAFHLPGLDFHSASAPAFWIFWGIMAICVALGFRPKQKHR